MALIELLSDYQHADLTVAPLYRQSQVDPATLASFDMVDPYGFGGVRPAQLPTGAVLLGYDAAERPATVTAGPIDLGVTGLVFTGNGNKVVQLPAAAKLPASVTRFGFGGWLRHADNSAGGSATMTVAGYSVTNVAAANVQWALQCARGAAGAQVNYNGVVGGIYTGAIPMAVGELAHVFIVATIANGAVAMSAYKNGGLLSAQAAQALPGGVLPTPAGEARLGAVPGVREFCGQIGSFDVQDFNAAGSATVADFLARAYGDNVGRFG